jgi:hypothetical protein
LLKKIASDFAKHHLVPKLDLGEGDKGREHQGGVNAVKISG